MAVYDLNALDDKEFEVLCCQILSIVEGKRFERFRPGRDGGVDGRYFSPSGGEVVLQCKHWARTPVASLIRSLEKKEQEKVQKLSPKRYILATSVELTRTDKQKITSIFAPFIASPTDVYGAEDITDLLAENPQVIREHPTLWLASAEVIGLIQNAAILGRSDFSLDRFRIRGARYVQTKNHADALIKLESNGAVVVTGIPGIGKTTLAEQLCFHYVLQGFELCVLGESIEEAEGVFKEGKRQVFYFDDFLGRNYLEALGRHEDSRIVGFLKRIQSDATKRFILTSRTTVLNQAKVLSDQFLIGKVDRAEIEIRVESLEPIDRARILHKHVWHSNSRVNCCA
jgi:adenylate kinase family enzyme